MITKNRHNKIDSYNIKVIDKNGHSFKMMMGANLDLYWVPERYRECTTFEIDKDDEITYKVFEQLFDDIRENDDKYSPALINNTITYLSDDGCEDEANVLNIIKSENLFTIKFIKNENESAWSYHHRGCDIRFCNSGSRVPKVEAIFMRMFNYLANNSALIPIEENNVKI